MSALRVKILFVKRREHIMKKVVLIVALLNILLLAGCSNANNSQNEALKLEQRQRNKKIKHNRKIWTEKVSKAKNINNAEYDKYVTIVPKGYNDEDMTLNRLKNGNQLLVVAQVVNLQPELGRLWLNETKATIHVERVISGDRSLKNHNILTEFSGGLNQAKDYFVSPEGKYVGTQQGFKPQTLIYSTNLTVPMPNIGQRIIVGLKKYQPDNQSQQKFYRKYGLTPKNFYVINNPEVTYWVAKNGQFKLNNPAFYQKQNRNKYPQLFKITKKLNQMY